MTPFKSLNILCAGECMVELREAAAIGQNEVNFAGDVINFATYLKRLCTSSSLHFLSATGNDALSEKMRSFLSGEDINLELLARSEDKTVGLYMINTDEFGERTFAYWRSDSAARKMFELADKAILSKVVDKADCFYFTGITLAILDPSNTEQLLDLVEQYRRKGKIIIFNPNYRARLWQSHDQALTKIERSYQLCDILFSSNEDEALLWGASSVEITLERLASYNIAEIILTNDPGEVAGFDHGRKFQVQPVKVNKIVDTISAGASPARTPTVCRYCIKALYQLISITIALS